MKNRSEQDSFASMQAKLVGLGESSVRKTYYPVLQQRIEELERFKALLDNSNEAIFLAEVPSADIVDVSQAATRQMGWEREEFLAENLFTITELGGAAEVVKLFGTPADGGESRLLVETLLHVKEGKSFPAEVTLNRMRFGGHDYVLAVARDVSERRQLQEQLLQSQKMEAIGQLAGGVAHDFNNILMVVMGLADMLLADDQLAEPHKTKVAQIMSSADKAAQLTSRLLSFSRKQTVHLRMTDLYGLITNMQRFLERIIGEDIQLQTSVPDQSLYLNLDAGQIEQVLLNLVTNARDAMPKGGTVRIEAAAQEVEHCFVDVDGPTKPGRYAVVSVSDGGVGMDDKTRQKIFEPFYTTKDPGKGTGLGLSIVYGIVKQHQGFINVYSEPGLGTTFRIYLPMTAAEPAQAAGERLLPARGGNETILVAEDEQALRQLMEAILSGYGYRVLLAADGGEAIATVRQYGAKIDLVLMDVIMPGVNGKEAFEVIHAARPELPVLFMSGYTKDIIDSRGLVDAGAELLMKPLQPQQLLRKVREILDARR
jgi:PAS domain S-box-containing protein